MRLLEKFEEEDQDFSSDDVGKEILLLDDHVVNHEVR
jgi:hypothetical protein